MTLREEGEALLRVAAEIREFISATSSDDENARSLLRDVATIERVGSWLASVTPIDARTLRPVEQSATVPVDIASALPHPS